MKMKRNIFVAGLASIALAAGGFAYANAISKENLSSLQLESLEALTKEEYRIGLPGTNWKTYTIECSRTVGFDYILQFTKTTTYITDACGEGWGDCLAPAGCL